jgi:hypothetical protein
MTSLQERMDLKSDPIDRAADADSAFVLGDNDSDVRAMPHQTPLLDAPGYPHVVTPPGLAEPDPSPQISIDEAATLAEPRHRSTAFVRMLLNGVRGTFTRSPKRPKRERKHYPPRFSLEFETSLVDRERRRL